MKDNIFLEKLLTTLEGDQKRSIARDKTGCYRLGERSAINLKAIRLLKEKRLVILEKLPKN